MTIAINSSHFGNVPSHEFETVEDALKHIVSNPSYEYLQNKRVRPYGDIDHYTPKGISEFEFDCLNCAVYLSIANHFEAIERQVSIYTASSFEAGKISLRWVVPDVFVDSQKHAKIFAETLYSQIQFPDGVKADLGVYNNNQKMRMVGTSKPNENRPLVCDGCEIIDTIITYIPENAEHIALELPAVPEYVHVPCDIADDTAVQLLDCLSVKSWEDYVVCRNLIWAMCSLGVSPDVIHKYASKGSNYETKWVDNLIRSHRPDRSPKLPYIRTHAKLDNPEAYRKIQLPNPASVPDDSVKSNIQELLKLTTDENTVIDTGRYVMPITEDKTGAVKAHLGTGKTSQIKKYIRKHLDKRILILSGRRTFSDAIYSDLKDVGFVHYEHHKQKHGRKVEIACDKLIIQVSPASMKLINSQSYDIVMCDEIETLLTMLSPLSIYKKMEDYVMMYQTFERIIRESDTVWVFDAFLTDRSMNMLKYLRSNPKLIINTTQPYNKKAVIIQSELAFYRTLRKRIESDKKKVVSVWGTVKAGEEFHKMLTHNKISNQFYHKKSDEKVKAQHMSDVNTHWAEYQSVGYTGTITVGINYTNPEHKFNQMSLYASAWGCGARDYAQAMHRAREITDNEVLIHISPNVKPCSAEAGFVNQEDMWDKQINLTKKTLEDLGESFDDYTTLPEWLKHVILWNRNETVMNYRHLPEFMKAYLELCGIKTDEIVEGEDKKQKAHKDMIQVEEVRIICNEEADYLISNRKCISEEDHYALERYFLSNYTNTIDQFIWEKWLKNKSVVEHAFMMVGNDPSHMVRSQSVKVLELVPKDIARLKLMKELLFDWKQSWELPLADIPVVDLSPFSLRKRSEKDTHEQYCRELAKCIEDWCGYAIRVSGKRIKKNNVCSYNYTMVYDFSQSTAKYIEPVFQQDE